MFYNSLFACSLDILSSDCVYKTLRITFVSENHEIIWFVFWKMYILYCYFSHFVELGYCRCESSLCNIHFFGRDCPRTFDSKSMTTEDAAAAAASAAL
jgi:hypothetical protein